MEQLIHYFYKSEMVTKIESNLFWNEKTNPFSDETISIMIICCRIIAIHMFHKTVDEHSRVKPGLQLLL